jgi:hypothetical protein
VIHFIGWMWGKEGLSFVYLAFESSLFWFADALFTLLFVCLVVSFIYEVILGKEIPGASRDSTRGSRVGR